MKNPRNFYALASRQRHKPSVPEKQAFFQKVKHVIHKNMDNDEFSAIALANELHVSPSQLNRKLNNVVDSTAGSLIREIRMSHAVALLSDDIPISEVASQVGYLNTSNFSRSFKRLLGCSPRDYLRRNNIDE